MWSFREFYKAGGGGLDVEGDLSIEKSIRIRDGSLSVRGSLSLKDVEVDKGEKRREWYEWRILPPMRWKRKWSDERGGVKDCKQRMFFLFRIFSFLWRDFFFYLLFEPRPKVVEDYMQENVNN